MTQTVTTLRVYSSIFAGRGPRPLQLKLYSAPNKMCVEAFWGSTETGKFEVIFQRLNAAVDEIH